MEALPGVEVVRTFTPRPGLSVVPCARHRVLAPHHTGLGSLSHVNRIERQLSTTNATPAELGLPYHLKSDLVEAILVKLLRSERTEAVGISAAVVLFAHAFSWSPRVLVGTPSDSV